jgi:serine/threonine protein kinase
MRSRPPTAAIETPEQHTLLDRTISHYRVVERLGGGGMGVVYEAEDTRLRRFVTLNCCPRRRCQRSAGARPFQREAETASALNHPNICTIGNVPERSSPQQLD